MAMALIKYDAKNEIAKGLLSVLTKISGVEIIPYNKEESDTKALLLEKAKKIDQSINKQAPKMTMSEIVKEVRDYRNGK